MGMKQRLADRLAEIGHMAVHVEPEQVEHNLSGQRVAVRVQSRGRKRDEGVARLDGAAVDDLRT
ncbi:hypothetical protein D3C83_122510 [compost metagenome]